jgi:UDP-N-acetylglucosamine transferase subunit ALG13
MGDVPQRQLKRVFVTVGTTKFEELIEHVDSEAFQRTVFESLGTREIIAQIGQGTIEPRIRHSKVEVSFYRMKPDIKGDMEAADLIITHCGAGSVTEAMKSGRPTVAAVNEKLIV